MKRQDWRNTQPGLWQLYADEGITVIAEVWWTKRDVFTGWAWSVRGHNGHGLYADARDGKIRCTELVLEAAPDNPSREQWD